MTTHDRYSPIISWCRARISQIRNETETPSREARLEELTHIVTLCQGLEVTFKLLDNALGINQEPAPSLEKMQDELEVFAKRHYGTL